MTNTINFVILSIDRFNKFCHIVHMKDNDADPRQQAIIRGAWTTFAAYGFRKTSMDDIARAAGMSRPALYLHYRNKEDIFRSLAQFFYDEAAHEIEVALAKPGTLREQITAAFEAQGGKVVESMLSSPHGMELLDSTKATAADIISDGEARLAAIYSAWLRGEVQAGRVRFDGSADEMAATITAALKGLKHEVPDYATYRVRLSRLASLIAAGLAAGGA